MNKIQSVPIDREGNLLFLKNFEFKDNKFFVEYRSMLNEIPFQKVEIWPTDEDKNFVITGNDGTVLYRIPTFFLLNVQKDESISKVSE